MKVLVLASVVFVSSLSFAAQLSFSGTVKNVQKCAWDKPVGVSEHNPNFMCADVEEPAGRSGIPHNYEVVFPASTDIAWFQFPKLRGNESGQFVLTNVVEEGHWVLTKFSAK